MFIYLDDPLLLFIHIVWKTNDKSYTNMYFLLLTRFSS